eukprot:ANDGO_08258.mRNA.1 hypothetical protein
MKKELFLLAIGFACLCSLFAASTAQEVWATTGTTFAKVMTDAAVKVRRITTAKTATYVVALGSNGNVYSCATNAAAPATLATCNIASTAVFVDAAIASDGSKIIGLTNAGIVHAWAPSTGTIGAAAFTPANGAVIPTKICAAETTACALMTSITWTTVTVTTGSGYEFIGLECNAEGYAFVGRPVATATASGNLGSYAYAQAATTIVYTCGVSCTAATAVAAAPTGIVQAVPITGGFVALDSTGYIRKYASSSWSVVFDSSSSLFTGSPRVTAARLFSNALGTPTYQLFLATDGRLFQYNAGTPGGIDFAAIPLKASFNDQPIDSVVSPLLNKKFMDAAYFGNTVTQNGVILLTEGTCSWFTAFKQVDFNADESVGFPSFGEQSRRDRSVCGMCAAYSGCAFQIPPAEILSGDFGRNSLGGVCTPFDGTAPAHNVQFKMSMHVKACNLDAVLYGDKRTQIGTLNNQRRYRSDTWFPFPEDASLTINSVVYERTFLETVWPNMYARYFVQPPNRYLNVHIVVMTHDSKSLGDNIDLVALRTLQSTCNLVTLDNFHYTSIRESNPWAIDILQADMHTSFQTPSENGGICFAVYGDNQYPQKSGPSEYKIRLFYDPDFPNFECRDWLSSTTLGISTNPWQCTQFTSHTAESTALVVPYHPTAAVAGHATIKETLFKIGQGDRFVLPSGAYGFRLNRRTKTANDAVTAGYLYPRKGTPEVNGFVYAEEVYLKDGWEMNYGFTVLNKYLCGGDDGFCGGGDGFACFVHGITGPYDVATEINTASVGASAMANMGFSLVTNKKMMLVEHDTWHNKDFYDPKQGVEHWWINATEYVSYADNHVAIFAAGISTLGTIPLSGAAITLDHSKDQLIAATPSIPNMSDGDEHKVKLWYLPSFSTHAGTVTIFMDNMDRPVLVGEITMLQTGITPSATTDWVILNDRGGGYVGCMGSNNDSPQDLVMTYWNFNRYPGRVGY